MRNDSIPHIDIELYVFNNVTNCHAAFLNWTAYPEDVNHPPIGDESAFFLSNDSTGVGIVFREVNIMVFVTVQTLSGSQWLYGTALYLAELQLQKIDHCLAG